MMLAFIKDAFPETTGINFLLASMSSFGGAVVSSAVMFGALLSDDWSKLGGDSPSVKVAGYALIMLWVLFIAGIITLLAFASMNFLAN